MTVCRVCGEALVGMGIARNREFGATAHGASVGKQVSSTQSLGHEHKRK